jgi:ABC-type branched-subunit amino acid transport system permease subunit
VARVPAARSSGRAGRRSRIYFLIVPLAVLICRRHNLFHTRSAAFIAIRDRDISAEVLGIGLFHYKLLARDRFFYAGVAGGLCYFPRRDAGCSACRCRSSVSPRSSSAAGVVLGTILARPS